MHSTLTPKQGDDPHDVVLVAPDAVRVAPSDDRIAPEDDELSKLLHEAARYRSDKQIRAALDARAGATVPMVDTTFRPAAVSDVPGSSRRRSIGRRMLRAFIALLLAACIGGAALAWQVFGYAGKKMIARWMPQFALTTSLPLDKLGFRTGPAPPADEADTADAANSADGQTTLPAQTATDGGAATAAAASAPDSAQLLQSMARDLASVGQEVEQLKTTIAELKASQQQMARDAAKAFENKAPDNRASEQNPRAKVALAPPRPPVARPRRPAPYPYPSAQTYPAPQSYPPTQATGVTPPPSQAAAPYYAPRRAEPLPPIADQPSAEPGSESVPRPPMPVR